MHVKNVCESVSRPATTTDALAFLVSIRYRASILTGFHFILASHEKRKKLRKKTENNNGRLHFTLSWGISSFSAVQFLLVFGFVWERDAGGPECWTTYAHTQHI